MRETLSHEILEFNPDTLQSVRESCGLGSPGRVDEALGLLQDWLAKQEHILNKNFSPFFLETLLLTSKSSVEKTKQRLDMICTMRTFAPELFAKCDAKNDFTELHEVCKVIVLPRMTDDHCRVEMLVLTGLYPNMLPELYQYAVILSEYLKLHDYCNGFVCIVDFRRVNMFELVSQVNLIELYNVFTLVTKGYGSRIKAIHLLTPSRAIDLMIALLRQVLSPKLMARVHVHRSPEELRRSVPGRVLPADLGGEERPIDTLHSQWLDVYSSEEHIRHMREMQAPGTDEARRRSAREDAMFGLPGTFRALDVD